jgi:hypothetical protein
MICRLLAAIPMLVLALLAQPAHAQFLYKSTMPDGRVIYGDSPVPGATKVEQSKPDTSKRGIDPPSAREAATLKQMEADRAAREQKADSSRSGDDALRRAEAALAAGKEPLPGERIGTAGGGSRLTDAYWQRQKMLEAAVEQARRGLQGGQGVDPGKGFDPGRAFK